MSQVYIPDNGPVLSEVLNARDFPATLLGAVRYSQSHINGFGDSIRFLTDYLDGDHYFRIHYPEQNPDRRRTQFKLVKDMEEQFEAMAAVVAK